MFGGVQFSGPPHFGPLMDFFLLNLGSTAPDYSRRPLTRSSKAPPNQKNRGQVLPHPSEPAPCYARRGRIERPVIMPKNLPITGKK